MRTPPPPADLEPWGGDDDYDLEREEELALAVEALRDPDPAERSDAVLDIDPAGRGLPYLLEVLSDDLDPEVRIAVVSQLANAESPEVIAGLVSALNDRDPEVVLEAIDALEFSADHAVIGSLEKLLQHRDPDVREAAEDAIERLEEQLRSIADPVAAAAGR
jgi:HEAT repeat protein